MTGSEPRSERDAHVLGRRRFFGYLVAAPTLVAAAELGVPEPGAATPAAGVPSPGLAEFFDANDLMTAAARPTSHLIAVAVNADGTVSFALPRAETGQGITTSTAMLIAEELRLPVDRVRVTLADARPELVFNQLTGGSNTTIATYLPVRIAAALARDGLLAAAAVEFGATAGELDLRGGVITSPSGARLGIGELAGKAASTRTRRAEVELTPRHEHTVIGTPHNRIDGLAAVTGRKAFAMDLAVPGAAPAMVCRPPTINGEVRAATNLAEVRAMPGVTDVVVISTGVAVRAETFGQCIDAVRALEVTWEPGSAAGKSDETVLADLRAAELPIGPRPPVEVVEEEFTFHFRSNSALEPNCAVADVRAEGAEIWSSLKSPILAQQTIAADLRLPVSAVRVHVTEGGGSFGRKLFFDGAREAAEISRALGKPVKLMWHRADDSRQGRTHPMAISRVRLAHVGNRVLGYDQRHTSVATDWSHGLGEIITALVGGAPGGDIAFSEVMFQLSQSMPYDFGPTTQLLAETDGSFNTGSMRNVYSPDVTCGRELVVDGLAAKLHADPYRLRHEFLQDDRSRAVLAKAAEVGDWGRPMPPGTAQGIAFHAEYRCATAALVEIDCTPETVERPIRDGVAGPRVTKVVFVVDAGLVVNPRGLEAQLMGGAMDGIALALTAGLHLRDGYFLEASWDDYSYTRQWNVPPELQVVIMPDTSDEPGGAGELAVSATVAAVACAYGRATGKRPTTFPINHGTLAFDPKPTVPPIPESPTDGRDHAR
ncbi:molybdopterin-dependent oxidoreductase [Saccharopolyspora sp. NFXS83]|uniref:molybdopterin cofactor-binding domain-containing protein n=1 Tax=Saccharopolyspora sp. NFXS83 TaxID=2993560 RepID=UPI00224B54FC|nr:molybdopterin cofactor-binding domain-containing protein [Saccharopolyspora sp. NFXS83]MCX2728744.1 molybdopterin-dependent oxidoreductase [Saccharopolyspora sp. NFXS83]